MKPKNDMMLVGVTILCAAFLAGCGGSTYKKADSTVSRINALKAELLDTKEQVGKMTTALNQVVDSADTNPRPAYETFKKEFEKTKRQAAKVHKRADEIKKQGQAYFKKWEAEYEKVASPEMKQRFEQRKAEMAAKYQKIQEYSQQVKADCAEFIQDLTDIQVVLGVDLTAKGIQSITDMVDKATRDAQTIYGHIDTYVSILNEVAYEMSPATK